MCIRDRECIDCFKLATKGLMDEEKQDALCDFILNKLENVEDMEEISKYLVI